MATVKTLESGDRRVGFFVDGDPRTPRMAAVLEDTGTEIRLTIPWIGGDDATGEGYRRWFLGDSVHFGDDPERTKYNYAVPNSIQFQDAIGVVHLVGGRFRGMRDHLFALSHGEGYIAFDFAVFGGGGWGTYERINGLRSELEGLGDWMGLNSLTSRFEADDHNRLKSADFHLESPPPVPVSRTLNTAIVPSFRWSRDAPDKTTIHERMIVETRVKDYRDWGDHLTLHNAVRDLLRLSAWRALDFVHHEAMDKGDPDTAHSGRVVGHSWRPVRTYQTRSGEGSASEAKFLFGYQETGKRGMSRWLRLRDTHGRGIDLATSSLANPAALESRLAEMGIAMEMLGFQIFRENGLSKTAADSKSHAEYVGALAGEITCDNPQVFGPDSIDRSVAAYHSVKHANRSRPDAAMVYLSWLESVIAFRLWVASRIGISRKHLATSIVQDGQFRAIQDLRERFGLAP